MPQLPITPMIAPPLPEVNPGAPSGAASGPAQPPGTGLPPQQQDAFGRLPGGFGPNAGNANPQVVNPNQPPLTSEEQKKKDEEAQQASEVENKSGMIRSMIAHIISLFKVNANPFFNIAMRMAAINECASARSLTEQCAAETTVAKFKGPFLTFLSQISALTGISQQSLEGQKEIGKAYTQVAMFNEIGQGGRG